MRAAVMHVLLVDHEDSYTHNLAHLIAACVGEAPQIVGHDDARLLALAAEAECIVLSPGPGSPLHTRDAGQSLALIRASDKPILGVCLGHQLLAYAYGARIAPALTPTHGYTSAIAHAGEGLFADLPQPFEAMRYHSLAVRDLPPCLRATAHTADGEIMAIAHMSKPHFGVQFHPESIGTPLGARLVENFFEHIGLCKKERAAENKPEKRSVMAAADLPIAVPWDDPQTMFARHFLQQPNAFFLAGTGRFAYAGCGALTHPSWAELMRERRVSQGPAPFVSGLVGLLAYDAQPNLFIRPSAMLIFDREKQLAWRVGALPPAQSPPAPMSGACEVSSCTAQAYARQIALAQDAIRAGEAYELCLTRQIHGTSALPPWQVFTALREKNPAPYSAYFKLGERALVAASPELFLRVSGEYAETSPIKGTRARGADDVQDRALAHDLAAHPKDRAENVMIVDVARHDLGGVCTQVEVTELCAVKTFPTVHQLVSTVRGELRSELTAADAARALFPPASMTGAPKARAREWLARIEKAPRGYYSGAYGWFSDDGACELAVTIRSLFFDADRVSFGVGGAILLGSDPENEWDESEIKAAASLRALGWK
jgi:para-aminobenzoate synthetase